MTISVTDNVKKWVTKRLFDTDETVLEYTFYRSYVEIGNRTLL